jgi:hypothetical protein
VRKAILAAAALVAVVAIFLLATLPPEPAHLTLDANDPGLVARTLAGAYHVHTTRSDGAADKREVAAAAARAGLQFVIFTDHGDATREPDPPEYLHGVLCIDAVEISTNGGHYVALGLPAAPYPLAGDAAAVVEDVARLGGFGIAAHPHHPTHSLAWDDWSAPVDGIEWINADVEWRNESPVRLARALFDYLVRPAPALASVFDRPDQTLEQWASLLRSRAVVALAAADAHGGARASSLDEGGSRFAIGPSYEASFRVVVNKVLLSAPPSGNAVPDALAVIESIRSGRVYTVIRGIADGLVLVPGGTGGLRFPEQVPPGVVVREIGTAPRQAWEAGHPKAAGHPPVPWAIANPAVPATERVPPLPETAPLGLPLTLRSPWRVEKDPRSSGQLSEVPGGFRLAYALAEGERVSQFVAAAGDVSLPALSGLAFSASAERPMRLSVQLRFPAEGERWVKSVYLDRHPRDLILRTSDLSPAERADSQLPDLTRAGSLLFVVDLTNAKPGARGGFQISGLRTLEQSPAAQR